MVCCSSFISASSSWGRRGEGEGGGGADVSSITIMTWATIAGEIITFNVSYHKQKSLWEKVGLAGETETNLVVEFSEPSSSS